MLTYERYQALRAINIRVPGEPGNEAIRVKGTRQMAHFYRRKLPEFCIPFSSDEGKKIFKEALDEGEVLFMRSSKLSRARLGLDYSKLVLLTTLLCFSGYMNCYFPLAAQFRTQEEPAYCGLSTLVMVLNALEVDPGRIWKGPWRW